MIRITVNGEPKEVSSGATVKSLIDFLGLGAGACAAEVNHTLVPKREHESRVLQPGDRVELVSLVGGG
jgi:thiamine biosynthesis protein ThiS